MESIVDLSLRWITGLMISLIHFHKYHLEKWTRYLSPGVDTKKINFKFETEDDLGNFLREYKVLTPKDVIFSENILKPVGTKNYCHKYNVKRENATDRIARTFHLEKWRHHISPGVSTGKVHLKFESEDDLGYFLQEYIQ